MNRARWSLLTLACVIVMLLVGAGASSIYTPGYIARVLIRQDANSDDYLWKASHRLPASGFPIKLETRPDVTVRRAIEASTDTDLDAYLANTRTTSLIVPRNGAIVFEAYANGGASHKPQPTFSLSKSVLSILVGMPSTRACWVPGKTR